MENGLLAGASLRRLRVFVEVCDTLHMARAAERLGIAQPSLSEQIAALEKALGARLFHRRKRSIDLTEAGQLLSLEARALLAAHCNAMDKVARVARGEMGRLAIGYVGSVMYENHLAAQLREMQARFPEVALTLREAGGKALIDGLVEGELDVILLRAPALLPPPLERRVHSTQQLVVVLPPAHPLERYQSLSIKQLAPFPMVGYPESDDDFGITPKINGMAHSAGVRLAINWKVTSVGSVLGLVAAGIGIGIAPDHAALRASMSTRPFKERADSELWLVWHAQRVTANLQHFLAITTPHA